jgi:hypothetical protein
MSDETTIAAAVASVRNEHCRYTLKSGEVVCGFCWAEGLNGPLWPCRYERICAAAEERDARWLNGAETRELSIRARDHFGNCTGPTIADDWLSVTRFILVESSKKP